jgi:ADP-ribose pyrophosphatase
MDIVRHPASVVLLPMQDDDHVILIRQYRHSIRREIWELPAGSVDAGESAEAAAARECEEEIALVPERVQRIAGLYPTPGYCDEEMIYFRVSGLHPPAPDSPHKPTTRISTWFHDCGVERLHAGEIVDLKTAYGLTLI